MAAIYSTTDNDTITEGLQGSNTCDQAINMAREEASERGETVHLKDDDGEWLVGPRGGVRKLTPALRRKYGMEEVE